MAFPTDNTEESIEIRHFRISWKGARIAVSRMPKFCAFLGSRRCRVAPFPLVLDCAEEDPGTQSVFDLSANLASNTLTFMGIFLSLDFCTLIKGEII